MDTKSVLSEALKARHEEVLHYQINIDNYERAIVKAAIDPELNEFVASLQNLLTTSKFEQKKASIMRDVIEDQLRDLA